MTVKWNLTCIFPPCSPGDLAQEGLYLARSQWHWSRRECDWRSRALFHLGCTCTDRPAVGWSQKWKLWQTPGQERTAYQLTVFMKWINRLNRNCNMMWISLIFIFCPLHVLEGHLYRGCKDVWLTLTMTATLLRPLKRLYQTPAGRQSKSLTTGK